MLAGAWLWTRRPDAPKLRAAGLAVGIAVALLFLVAAAVTPINHSTAPFVIGVPGTDLVVAPSGRFLAWAAAAAEFARHPLIGHGIGIHAVNVQFHAPAGNLQTLADAHNMFLNIAAQAGVIGLAGLALLIACIVRLGSPWGALPAGLHMVRLCLSLTLLTALVYQGLSGSFEDARHLWVLLGLLLAAYRLDLSPPGGNNRRAGEPSPC